MSAAAPPLELTWVLVASKRAVDIKGDGTYVRNKERFGELADTPPGLPSIENSYGVISAYACKMNQSQIRSGFLDYLYYPDIKGSTPPPPERGGLLAGLPPEQPKRQE